MLARQDAIKDCDHAEMVTPLVLCLSDKKPQIRAQSEEICIVVMTHSGFRIFQDSIKDLKPAMQQTMKPVLERIKGKCGTVDVPMEETKKEEPKPAARPTTASGPTRKGAVTIKSAT